MLAKDANNGMIWPSIGRKWNYSRVVFTRVLRIVSINFNCKIWIRGVNEQDFFGCLVLRCPQRFDSCDKCARLEVLEGGIPHRYRLQEPEGFSNSPTKSN
ncbi:hypothetical protein MICRO11B_290069 [Micrococcus luteus]|nr:hypothetical protein MICRO11B_290069 [Micrococcus luteus]